VNCLNNHDPFKNTAATLSRGTRWAGTNTKYCTSSEGYLVSDVWSLRVRPTMKADAFVVTFQNWIFMLITRGNPSPCYRQELRVA